MKPTPGRKITGFRYALSFAGLLLASLAITAAIYTATPPGHAHLRWIVGSSGLTRLKETPHPPGLLRRAFDNNRTWLIVGSHPPTFLKTWRCRRVLGFRSYEVMEKRLGSPKGIWGVLYDPESWPFTPMTERRNVPHYTALAAHLVHSRGLKLIVTPATDLVRSIVPPHPGRTFENSVRDFVRLRLAEQTAPATDVYEIQSQGAETDKNLFVWYVTQESAQVRSANRHAILLAGLSTNPHGLHVTAREVFNEVLATRHLVQGYWLNVPKGGPGCPTCGEAQPQVGIELLKMLQSKGLL